MTDTSPDRVRVAMIGAGSMANNVHYPSLASFDDVEIAAICERLREREFKGSYSAVRRFVNNLETVVPEVFVRVECKPGEEVQVDFGYAGQLIDPESGELRRAWAFVTPALAPQVQV